MPSRAMVIIVRRLSQNQTIQLQPGKIPSAMNKRARRLEIPRRNAPNLRQSYQRLKHGRLTSVQEQRKPDRGFDPRITGRFALDDEFIQRDGRNLLEHRGDEATDADVGSTHG